MAIEGICRISTARIAAIAMFLLLIASEGAAVLAMDYYPVNFDIKEKGIIRSTSPFIANVSPQPVISNQTPPPNIETIIPQAVEFNFSINQPANVSWFINGIPVGTPLTLVTFANYTNKTPQAGTWNVTAFVSNNNGTAMQSWNWSVRPRTWHTGNRIWDGCKPNLNSLTYTWDPMSFYGFYYNVDDDIGTESLTVTMNAYDSREISDRNLVYSTSASEVSFQHKDWGKYKVIGFMADKYFAGYTTNTNFTRTAFNTLNSKQLHKVLMDSDDKYTVYSGSSLTLKDGYVMRIKDVDVTGGKIVLFSLLKDGNEVDSTAVTAGNDYVYTKRVGVVSDLPVIAVHVDTVFVGREANAAFIKGIFQVSEVFSSVTTGKTYDAMKITTVGGDRIEMKNNNSISLSTNSVVDIMGNLKFKVADNICVRFAPVKGIDEAHEARGAVASDDPADIPFIWTPMNFEGLYYDIDNDIGTETLEVRSISGRNITAGNLIYSTSPEPAGFKYTPWGNYTVIGFLSEKYFAGYNNSGIKYPPAVLSTLDSKQIHKVLMDSDDNFTVYSGSSLTLKEGYAIHLRDVDITGHTVLLSLFKNGIEIDTAAVPAGNTYIYEKNVGNVSGLPIIAVHIDSIIAGIELNTVFIKGIFQISESYDSVLAGSNYGIVKIENASAAGITMENENPVELSRGSIINVTGNIKFRVADSDGLRYYPLMNPEGTPPTWNVFQNGTVVEISYGSGRNFPQYAALHIDSGYFRLVAPDTTWGTSVILLPSFWENGTYYQGARVTYEWYVDGPDLVLLLRGNISNLAANIKMRIFPPAGDAIQAAVEGNVTGNAEIDKRSGEAFKPVMLSSMHISSGFWDSQSAYSNSTEFSIPDEGWIVWPPVNSSLFGLKGGSSGWKTNAATVEIQLDKSFEITGWVTKSSNPDDDNVGFWAASGDIVSNWNYTIVARKKPVNIPFPGLYAFPTDPDGDGLYEDINGNGRKDFNDVVVFFNNLEWVPDNEPVSWFDFNGNGRIDFDDIVSLFEEI